jgi:hypothetical protein
MYEVTVRKVRSPRRWNSVRQQKVQAQIDAAPPRRQGAKCPAEHAACKSRLANPRCEFPPSFRVRVLACTNPTISRQRLLQSVDQVPGVTCQPSVRLYKAVNPKHRRRPSLVSGWLSSVAGWAQIGHQSRGQAQDYELRTDDVGLNMDPSPRNRSRPPMTHESASTACLPLTAFYLEVVGNRENVRHTVRAYVDQILVALVATMPSKVS